MMTANHSAAYAAKLARIDVAAIYPITPQTTISEKITDMAAKGEMDAKVLLMESEHSAMSALIGASYLGARTFTATSSQGLAFMHEMLMWASGVRRPIVMPVAARAIGGPWNMWCEHHDVMSERDTGWIQIFCENDQDVLDTTLQAYKISEDRHISLPSMIIEDGFILSHTYEAVDIPDQDDVDDYLPAYRPEHSVDVQRPARYGGLVTPDWWMEFRHGIAAGMESAKEHIISADMEFKQQFGRSCGGLFEEYRCDDADAVLVIAGSAAGTAKDVADSLRATGDKVGVLKLRVFRPFPSKELASALSHVPVVGVLDRSYTFGDGGNIFNETRSALFGGEGVRMKSYVAGLGGRDIRINDLKWVFKDLLGTNGAPSDERTIWVGLKDGSGRW